MLSFFLRREKLIQAELKPSLFLRTKTLAEELIDIREQVRAIGYEAKIQSLSSSHDASKSFVSKAIPRFEFEKLYWPVQGEFWWDEIPFYQAQISSQCGHSFLEDLGYKGQKR